MLLHVCQLTCTALGTFAVGGGGECRAPAASFAQSPREATSRVTRRHRVGESATRSQYPRSAKQSMTRRGGGRSSGSFSIADCCSSGSTSCRTGRLGGHTSAGTAGARAARDDDRHRLGVAGVVAGGRRCRRAGDARRPQRAVKVKPPGSWCPTGTGPECSTPPGRRCTPASGGRTPPDRRALDRRVSDRSSKRSASRMVDGNRHLSTLPQSDAGAVGAPPDRNENVPLVDDVRRETPYR